MVRAVADAAEGATAVRDGSLSAWLHVLRAEALRGQQVLEAPGCDAAAVAGSARHFLTGLRETAKAGGPPQCAPAYGPAERSRGVVVGSGERVLGGRL